MSSDNQENNFNSVENNSFYPGNPNNQNDRSTVNALGIAGLVVGIIALLISFIPCFGIIALFIAILGLILSGIGLYMANKNNFEKGLVIAGVAISGVALAISLVQWTIAGSAIQNAEKNRGTWLEELEKSQEENKRLEEERQREMEEMQKELDTMMEESGQ